MLFVFCDAFSKRHECLTMKIFVEKEENFICESGEGEGRPHSQLRRKRPVF